MSIAIMSKVIGFVRRWYLRRQECQALSRLDDHLLRDIGIERFDIERVVDLHMGYLRQAESESQPERAPRDEFPGAGGKCPAAG